MGFFSDTFNGGFIDSLVGSWDNVSDWFSGYTQANSANRFNQENMLLQQSLNSQSMAEQFGYNKQLQEMAQQYNADQSALAFERQKQLYGIQLGADNTRYQRAVKDLRRAGINPLLVAGGVQTSSPSPSSVNSASSASSSVGSQSVGLPSVSQSENVSKSVGAIASVFNAYSGLAQLGSSIANSQADTALKVAQRGESAARTAVDLAKAKQIVGETKMPGLLGQAIRSLQSLGTDTAQQASDLSSEIEQYNADSDLDSAAHSAMKMRDTINARENHMKVEETIKALENKKDKSSKEIEKLRRLKNAKSYRESGGFVPISNLQRMFPNLKRGSLRR